MMKIKNYDFEKAIYNELEAFEPDIVGLTCLTPHVNSAKKILKIVRDHNPKILTIIGGLHTTLNPEDFCMPEVDLVAIGPGKRTMRSIVDAYKENIVTRIFQKYRALQYLLDDELKFTRRLAEMSRKELKDEHYLYYDKDEYFPNRDLTRRYNYIIEQKI